jgi:hypothetical protein
VQLTGVRKPNIPSWDSVFDGFQGYLAMRPFRKLGLRLARIETIRRAIDERADLAPFKAKPSLRLLIGVGLIGLSMLLGWPLISVMGSLAIYFAEPLIAVIGGPAAYGLSWAVYGLGLLIAGREALYYMNVFNKWFARVAVEKMIGSPPLSPEEVPAEAPEETKAEKDPAAD